MTSTAGGGGVMQSSAKTMFCPPECVRGMTILDRDAFKATVLVPYVRVPSQCICNLMKRVRDSLLTARDVKPVLNDSDSADNRLLLLDVRKYSSASELGDDAKKALSDAGVDIGASAGITEVPLSYDSWSADEIFHAVLPIGASAVSSFSIVGHVAHVNLKEHLLPYKLLIGQVLLDKNKCLRTVVNKTETIDNTFRNFCMEVIAGECNTDVTVKENGCVYRFDFSKVYWNPRLSTEHERVTATINSGDIVYDVFAGVGPFSVPAAKKACTVFANDLNQASYMHLCENLVLNKVKGSYKTFNLDGRAFIRNIVKTDLLQRLTAAGGIGQDQPPQVHIIMNLPALAADFLDCFSGLLHECWTLLDASSSDSAARSSSTEFESSEGTADESLTLSRDADGCRAAVGRAEEAVSAAAHGTAADDCCNVDAQLDQGAGKSATAPRVATSLASPAISTPLPFRDYAVCCLRQKPPLVHCYSFGKGDDLARVRAQVADRMNTSLGACLVRHDQVRHVRNVAPNKNMFCATFPLLADLLLGRPCSVSEKLDRDTDVALPSNHLQRNPVGALLDGVAHDGDVASSSIDLAAPTALTLCSDTLAAVCAGPMSLVDPAGDHDGQATIVHLAVPGDSSMCCPDNENKGADAALHVHSGVASMNSCHLVDQQGTPVDNSFVEAGVEFDSGPTRLKAELKVNKGVRAAVSDVADVTSLVSPATVVSPCKKAKIGN